MGVLAASETSVIVDGMADPTGDPLQQRTHLDEVAAAREIKREREIADRLDQRQWMMEHPGWPGHANTNNRPLPDPLQLSPEVTAEVDRLLDQLVPEPGRETLLQKLKREAAEQGRPLEAKLKPHPERTLERRLDEDRW